MREIKFRALSYSSEEWIYGVPVKSNGWTKMAIVWEIYHVDGAEYNVYEEDIIPETIGEYTGQKDKNGVELYEGDIVKYKGLYDYEVGILEYINNGFWVEDKLGDGSFMPCEFVVIGNIHENPELLEGKL